MKDLWKGIAIVGIWAGVAVMTYYSPIAGVFGAFFSTFPSMAIADK